MRPSALLTLATAFLLICLSAAYAGSLYWNPGQTTSGSGGDGHWYPTSAVWYPGTGPANQVWSADGSAVFAGNPGSVIFNSTQYGGLSAAALTFTRGDYFFENLSCRGSATHHIGTLSLGSGLFTYTCDYIGTDGPGDVWDVSTLNGAQGAAMMLYMNNLGVYKRENHSLFTIASKAGLGLVGGNAAFAAGAPNYQVSVVPYMVYAKFNHLPYYTFIGYDAANNSLRPLIGGQENNSQQCPVLNQATTPLDNVRLAAPASVTGPKTINSLVLDGCGYAPSTADITGGGALTISSGAILYMRAPENFSNPVIFPTGVEGHIFVANGRVWANAGAFAPTIRSSFSGDKGVTITGQPDYIYDYKSDSVTTKYNPDPITLAGRSSYTGITTINAARVVVSSPANFGNSGMIILNAGAVLAPTADNFLTRNQSLTMNPGSVLDAAGRATWVKDIVFGAGSLGVLIHSSTQLRPAGTVHLNGATLKLILDAAPTDGKKITLVSSSGHSAIDGTFAGLAEGAMLTASYEGKDYTFAITYTGGRGHDVVLTAGGGGGTAATAVAGPSAVSGPPAKIAPVITSSPRYSSMLGTLFYYRIVASNNPTSFQATGLPDGLTINASTGVISGTTPKTQGTISIGLEASNAAGAGKLTLTLTVFGQSVYQGPTKEAPYFGKPFAIPGRIFCVDYDLGGPGVAYNDEDVGNHYVPEGCAWYRNPHDDVDIPDRIPDEFSEKGFVIGVHGCGGIEWEKYTINAETSGNYNVEVRTACATSTGHIHIEIDDVDVAGSMLVPISGGWTKLTTQTASAGYIKAGHHVVKLCIDWDGDPHDGGMSMNWMNFVYVGAGTAPKR